MITQTVTVFIIRSVLAWCHCHAPEEKFAFETRASIPVPVSWQGQALLEYPSRRGWVAKVLESRDGSSRYVHCLGGGEKSWSSFWNSFSSPLQLVAFYLILHKSTQVYLRGILKSMVYFRGKLSTLWVLFEYSARFKSVCKIAYILHTNSGRSCFYKRLSFGTLPYTFIYDIFMRCCVGGSRGQQAFCQHM